MCLQPGRDALMNTLHASPPFTAGVRPWPPGEVPSAGPDVAVLAAHRLSPIAHRPFGILGIQGIHGKHGIPGSPGLLPGAGRLRVTD